MKRIVAAKQADDSVRQWYAELENSAWHLGYTMSLDTDLNLSFTNSDSKMPELNLTKVSDDGDIFYDVEVICPELHSDSYSYVDSIEYQMSRFYEVGKFVTEINKFVYNPANYED